MPVRSGESKDAKDFSELRKSVLELMASWKHEMICGVSSCRLSCNHSAIAHTAARAPSTNDDSISDPPSLHTNVLFEANRKRRRELVELRWRRVRRNSMTDRDASEATTPTLADPDSDAPLQLDYHGALHTIPTACVNSHAKMKWVGKDGARTRKQARERARERARVSKCARSHRMTRVTACATADDGRGSIRNPT
jgi:hypothetical protein